MGDRGPGDAHVIERVSTISLPSGSRAMISTVLEPWFGLITIEKYPSSNTSTSDGAGAPSRIL